MFYNFNKNRPSGIGRNMYLVIDSKDSKSVYAISVKYLAFIEKNDEYLDVLVKFNDNKDCKKAYKYLLQLENKKDEIWEITIPEYGCPYYSVDYTFKRDLYFLKTSNYFVLRIKNETLQHYKNPLVHIQSEDRDSPIRDISRQFYISPSRNDMFKFIKELRNDFDYYYDNLHKELSSLEESINIENITLRDLKRKIKKINKSIDILLNRYKKSEYRYNLIKEQKFKLDSIKKDFSESFI